MRRLLALIVLVVVAPTAAGLTAVSHRIDVVAGDTVGVVEHLDDVERLAVPIPDGARVEAVHLDGRPAAWSRRDGVVHAGAAGNYSLAYRLPGGRVDLVRTTRYETGNVTLTVDHGPGWQVQGVGLAGGARDGRWTGTAENVAEGDRFGVHLTPPATPGLTTRLVPFLAVLVGGLAVAGGVAVWRLRSPETVRMTFWDHYRELRHRIILTLVPLGVAFFVFFLFHLAPRVVLGATVLVPVPSSTGGMAGQVFSFFRAWLLPSTVELIVTNPVDAILAEITVGLFLALVATSPIAAYHVARFLGPALYPDERRVILRTVPAVTGLFLAGCLFGLILVVPFAFEFLYAYGRAIGAITFVTAQEFVSFTVLLVLAFGLSFELPIAMVAASELGAGSELWRDHWRLAVVVIFVFAAVVTPDGSGVTMFMVGLPLVGLYGLGYWLVRRRERQRAAARRRS